MTGDEIKALRETLELSRKEFADFLGVATQAVHRWEKNGTTTPPIKQYSRRFLELLQKQIDIRQGAPRERFVAYVSHGIRRYGGLVGVYRLLAAVYEGRNDIPP